MASDDTNTDPLLFKNVVRRPRSAISAERPRKEEPAPDGGDPAGGRVSPPATSSSKRPSSMMGKLVMCGESSSPSVVGASSKSMVNKKKKKAATDFFPDKAHVTDALRTILASLDASDPTPLYEKRMPASDRDSNQNRLLMSCKCESKRASFASIFTDTEMPLVHNPEPALLKTTDQDKEDTDKDDADQLQGSNKQRSMVPGLPVQAYDRDGRAYQLKLKYLLSNTAYRLVGPDWTVFLENNGLLVVDGAGAGGVTRKRSAGTGRRKKPRRSRSLPLPDEEEPNDDEQPAPAVRDDADDVQIEIWAFRSPKLPIGEMHQPGGALGLLLLHYHGGEAGVGGAAATEDEEVQVPAPAQAEPEVVGVVVEHEQPQQKKSNGMATQDEDADMVAAGDCGGDVSATVVDDDDATGKLGDAAPRRSTRTRDLPLSPLETLIAVWLFLKRRSHGCS